MAQPRGHKQFVYDDFTGGERGDIHARKAPGNMFSAINMVVYGDGCLGPRAGLKEYTELGGTDYQNGHLTSIAYIPGSPTANSQEVWYTQDHRLHYFLMDEFGTQDVGQFATLFTDVATDPGIIPLLSLYSYYTIAGDGTYRCTLADHTMTKITDAPGGAAVIEYLDQLYVCGTNPPNRVEYSAAGDFDTWPVGNFFDIGYAWPVQRVFRFQNGLVFLTGDQRWWLLQGTPDTGTLRSIIAGRGDGSPYNAFVDRENVWCVVKGDDATYPMRFTGSTIDTDKYKYLRVLPTHSDISGLVSYGDEDYLWIATVGSTNRGLMQSNGVWTQHAFDLALSHFCTRMRANYFMLTVDGDASHKPRFFRSQFGLNRPSFVSDDWSAPGDGSNTPFYAAVEFKEEWGDSADMLRPKSVQVEFTSYDTGSETDNNMDVFVKLVDRFGSTDDGMTDVVNWTEPSASSGSYGVRHKKIFSLNATSAAGGVQVTIMNIKGVKIERVVLDCEVEQYSDRY